MEEFKFKCRGFNRTIYNAKLVDKKYLVTWEDMLHKVEYHKKDVEDYIRDKKWIIVNELTNAEDF